MDDDVGKNVCTQATGNSFGENHRGRALRRLLASRRNHHNPFARELKISLQLNLSNSTKIADTDKVEIAFGLPDPAVSKLKIGRPDGNG